MTTAASRQRLDQALVSRGLVETRARARDLILRGEVTVDGRGVQKPALIVTAAHEISVVGDGAAFVSRGALKLRAALQHFGFEARGRVALDIGASTGGFTEILLAAGAAKVFAVENGVGQLHSRLSADPRVRSLETCDARHLDRGLVPDPIGAIVADVSFISLTKALPAALELAIPGCWLVALIKPQFEAGPGRVPRDGVVKDPAVQGEVVAEVEAWLASRPGWTCVGHIPSPIHGGDGNVEFLMGATRMAAVIDE